MVFFKDIEQELNAIASAHKTSFDNIVRIIYFEGKKRRVKEDIRQNLRDFEEWYANFPKKVYQDEQKVEEIYQSYCLYQDDEFSYWENIRFAIKDILKL